MFLSFVRRSLGGPILLLKARSRKKTGGDDPSPFGIDYFQKGEAAGDYGSLCKAVESF